MLQSDHEVTDSTEKLCWNNKELKEAIGLGQTYCIISLKIKEKLLST